MESDSLINQPTSKTDGGKEREADTRQKDDIVRGARGPFSMPPGVKLKLEVEESEQMESAGKPVRVEGIVVSGAVKRVIINDHILSVGDKLQSWQVMDIQRRSVVLGNGEKRIEIPVSENFFLPSPSNE